MGRSLQAAEDRYWWRREEGATSCPARSREGDACPSCGESELARDSLFVLSCPRCGYVAESGAFT